MHVKHRKMFSVVWMVRVQNSLKNGREGDWFKLLLKRKRSYSELHQANLRSLVKFKKLLNKLINNENSCMMYKTNTKANFFIHSFKTKKRMRFSYLPLLSVLIYKSQGLEVTVSSFVLCDVVKQKFVKCSSYNLSCPSKKCVG